MNEIFSPFNVISTESKWEVIEKEGSGKLVWYQRGHSCISFSLIRCGDYLEITLNIW